MVGKTILHSTIVFRLTRDSDDPVEKWIQDEEFRLGLKHRQFRTALSLKAKHKDDPGGLEAHGLCVGRMVYVWACAGWHAQ